MPKKKSGKRQTTVSQDDANSIAGPNQDRIRMVEDTFKTSQASKVNDAKIPTPKLQPFRGDGDKITITNWLLRFESIANYYSWSDDVKCVMVPNYLEDGALNWFLETTRGEKWNDAKETLVTRFGIKTVDPLIECVDLKLDEKTDFKDYFERKRMLGHHAGLNESQIISLLIHGLPGSMKMYFTATKPITFAEFYAIGLRAELTNKQLLNEQKQRASGQGAFAVKYKERRKPPNPCRICENLGFNERYHWASDCRLKGKPNAQKHVQAISAEAADRSFLHTHENTLPLNE